MAPSTGRPLDRAPHEVIELYEIAFRTASLAPSRVYICVAGHAFGRDCGRIVCRPRGTRAGNTEQQHGRHSPQGCELDDPTERVCEDRKGGGTGGGEHQYPDSAQAVGEQGTRATSISARSPTSRIRRRRRSEQRSAGTGQLPGLLQPLLRRPGSRRAR